MRVREGEMKKENEVEMIVISQTAGIINDVHNSYVNYSNCLIKRLYEIFIFKQRN